MAALNHHREWLEHNNKTVKLNGIKCKVKVSTGIAKYPYEYEYITVYAEPINKNSKLYRQRVERLHDDWSWDLLGSFELGYEALKQLEI